MASPLRSASAVVPITAREAARTGLHRGLLLVALMAAILSKNELATGVSYGELILLALVAVATSFALVAPGFIRLHRDFAWQLALAATAVVGATYAVQWGTMSFQFDQFLASFVKLVFYFASALGIGAAICSLNQRSVARIVSAVLLISALVGWYVSIAMATGGALPYEFLWFGQQAPTTTAFFGADEHIVRMRGLFSEPSLFGSFQALGLAYLLLVAGVRLPVSALAVIVTSIVLSLSLTAYGLLLVTLSIYFARRSENRSIPTLAALLVFCALGALFASEQLEQAIYGRALSVVAGTDVSGFARLIATWELPLDIIDRSPVFGAGLGNMDVVFWEIGSRLEFEQILIESPQGWNVAAYVLGSLGLLGLTAFTALCTHLLRTTGSAALVFIAYMFTTGALLEPAFWVFYALFYYGGQQSAPRRLSDSVSAHA